LTVYISPIDSDKWDSWREEWVIVQIDAHD
jgi:hypothetical protein